MVWNLAKGGGWDRYKLLTNEYSEALRKAIITEDSVEEKMDRFEKILDKKSTKPLEK